MRNRLFLALALYCLLSTTATAQTTAFTYQGKLTDGGTLANGQYDLQVKLFDALTEGTQQGTTLTLSNVAVVNGIFTVQLDFGACASCFNGAARYLEVAVKKTTDATFVTLTPRQPVSSTPYAMKTRNLSFNGAYDDGSGTVFTASNTFTGEGAGLNTTPASALNDGNGKFNAFFGAGAGQLNTNGFSNAFFGAEAGFNNTTGNFNAFFGSAAGASNTAGNFNSFFGTQTGQANTTGFGNSFFGSSAGFNNTTGQSNSFFGRNAGVSNTTGGSNVFVGSQAGQSNTTGFSNAFVGANAGQSNTTGVENSFFGLEAGSNNTTGFSNAFFGSQAGYSNTTGGNNTFIGNLANFNTNTATGNNNTLLGFGTRVNSGVSNSAAIGANATVMQSNSLVLGGITGVNGGTSVNVGIGTTAPSATLHVVGSTSLIGNVGIGTTAPNFKLTVADSSNTGLRVATAIEGGTVASFGGFGAFEIDSPGFVGGRLRVAENGLVTVGRSGVGGDLTVFGNTILNTVTIANGATLNVLGAAGSTSLCRNASNQISTCSSSLRYKQNIHAFASGLSLVNRLRPVTFNWKTNNEPDLGLVAEEVAKVEPLLVTRNDKGEIEGVKYDRVAVVLLNAIKEQQAQLQTQQEQLRERERQAAAQQSRLTQYESQLLRQEQELAALKRMVCASRPRAEGCRATKRKK